MIFTVLFARLLGAEDYGSLAALVSTFVILAVPGSRRAGRRRARDRARAARIGPQLAATLASGEDGC